MTQSNQSPENDGVTGIGVGFTTFFAVAAGALVANLYYAQPLVAPIAADLGLAVSAESAIVTATQIGYGIGLIALVPLGDVVENRTLILATMAANVAALIGFAFSPNLVALFAMMAVVGVTSTAAQMLVPLAAHLAPPQARGQVVGNVMAGLFAGILLARPMASFLSEWIGWRGIFVSSAALLCALILVGFFVMPRRRAAVSQPYPKLVASLGRLFLTEPVLRRRALLQASVFATFSMFWTGAPLILLRPPHELTQSGIALFALSGALGILAAPVAGRMADRGHARRGTFLAIGCVAMGFAIAGYGQSSVAALVAAAILIDLGAQANLVIGQREIFQLDPSIRNRINAVYMATAFLGAAIGSAVLSPTLNAFGWIGVCVLGVAFPACAFVYAFLAERGNEVAQPAR